MSTLKDKKEQIEDFYSLDEEAKDALIEFISNYADNLSESELAKEIRDNFEQNYPSGIGVIYEALSLDPKKWGDFFKDEIIRAFKSAEDSNSPYDIIDALEEISLTNVKEVECRSEIIDFLSNYLSSNKDVLRYKSIWILGDWIAKDNISENRLVILKIQDCLKDENWKIRTIAKQTLDELEQLPKGFKLSLTDRLKGKFLNPYDIK